MIIAVMLGCIISFLCGAGVVYGMERQDTKRTFVNEENDEKLHRQWVEFLSYDGSGADE